MQELESWAKALAILEFTFHGKGWTIIKWF